jgi:hypothetical protein
VLREGDKVEFEIGASRRSGKTEATRSSSFRKSETNRDHELKQREDHCRASDGDQQKATFRAHFATVRGLGL